MKKIIPLIVAMNISLLAFADTLNASPKVEMNGNYISAYSQNDDYAKEADTLAVNNDKGSIFYPFDPFIAIPVSFLSGIGCGWVFMKILPEDESDELSGVAEMMQILLGFGVGFVGSLSTFIILAYKKGKEEDAKNRTSTLDFSITNHSLPVKSRIYFLNYKYHF